MFRNLKIIRILNYKDKLQISFFSILLFYQLFRGLNLNCLYPLIKFSISTEKLKSFNVNISYNFEQIEIIYFLSLFIDPFLKILFSIYFIYWKSNFLI